MFRVRPATLHDSQVHGIGSGAELFLVEGDSASKIVCRARDPRTQAVLPMQGKPLNAIRANKSAVAKNEWLDRLITALGADWDAEFNLAGIRYDRVILLFDPDADGIHCQALMTMFFYRWMRPMLDVGRVCEIRPPLYQILSTTTAESMHAYSEDHYQRLRRELDRHHLSFTSQRYRGLASMNADVLRAACIEPETRTLRTLGSEDAEAAIAVFMKRG